MMEDKNGKNANYDLILNYCGAPGFMLKMYLSSGVPLFFNQ